MDQSSIWFALFGGFLIIGLGNCTTTCTAPGFNISSNSEWCFALTTVLETWPQKSISCRAYGATLVTIEDSTKRTQLETYLGTQVDLSSSDKIWLGLTNALNDSDWTWFSRGTGTSIDWASGQPVSTSLYNCGYMTNGSPDFLVSNENCLRGYNAVCQMRPEYI